MSRFQEFCESLRAGKARADEEQLEREERLRDLPVALGEVFRRMCASFRCPASQAHYVDLEIFRQLGRRQFGRVGLVKTKRVVHQNFRRPE